MVTWSQFFKTQPDSFFTNLNFEVNKIKIDEYESRICIHEDFFRIQENHCEIFGCNKSEVRNKVREIIAEYQKDLLEVRLKAFKISSNLDIDENAFYIIKDNAFGLLNTFIALPTHFDNSELWKNFPEDFAKYIETTNYAKISSEGRILASEIYRSLDRIETDTNGRQYWDKIVNGVRRGHDYFSYVKCLINSGKFTSIEDLMISKANHEGLHGTFDYLLDYSLSEVLQLEMDVFIPNSRFQNLNFFSEIISKIFDQSITQLKVTYEYSLNKLKEYLENPKFENYDICYICGPKVLENIASNYFNTTKLFLEIDEESLQKFLEFLFENIREFKLISVAKDGFLKQVEYLLYLTEKI